MRESRLLLLVDQRTVPVALLICASSSNHDFNSLNLQGNNIYSMSIACLCWPLLCVGM